MRVELSARTKIALGFAVPAALIAGMVALSHVNTARLLEHAGWVSRTHRAVAAGSRIVSSMIAQESGHRGFLLTGDEAALETYARGKTEFREALAAAEEIVSEDLEQMDRLSRVSELADTWDTQYARALIAARRDVVQGRATMDDVLKLDAEKDGAATMAKLRAVVAELTAAEEARLAARDAETAAQARWARWSVLLLGAFALALTALQLAMVLRSIGAAIRQLATEAVELTRAVAAGRLSHRAAPEAVAAEYRPVLDGINAVIEAVARPIETASACLVRISNGDIPPPIEEQAEGDFARINDALNRCIESVGALVEDTSALAMAGAEGRLSIRADPARHRGEFRRVVEGVNATLDAVVRPLHAAASSLDRLARGELPEPIEEDWKGDFAGVRDSLNSLLGAFRGLLAELEGLTRRHAEGDTEAEVDATRFAGAYRTLAAGMSDSVQAYVRIVRELLAILQRYAGGDFEPVLRQLPGKQARANRALEELRANLRDVSAEVNGLVEAARAGDLHRRADAGRFRGDWARMVGGLNATLDEVVRPVDEAAAVLDRLAARDLRARMTGDYGGEHARVKEAVNGTAEALHDALGQVAAAVEQVSSAAAQIASSAQAVASGASEQASSLEETTASVEDLARRAREAAGSAVQARALVVSARGAATQGAAAVEGLQGSMGAIRRSAEGTGAIIRDVSEIAFQTNLLALNAAVEAARAGEAGRGFAVVAEEVRSLALRAKEAAQKTEALIGESVRHAAEGAAAAERVSGALREIVAGVSEVTGVVDGIATAEAEQANGIEQVNGAILEMDKVTQQNAASAEESSSAASELSGQAEELAAMVATFQLGSGKARGAPRPGERADARRALQAPVSPAARSLAAR
jgi:methyl-accepting chemotaxis protein